MTSFFIIDPGKQAQHGHGALPLFSLPLILLDRAVCAPISDAKASIACASCATRRLEFALAGAILFTLFVMSVDRYGPWRCASVGRC